MDAHDNNWWLVHTGEYVLGLLDEQDITVLNRVMQHEPEIEKLVTHWNDWFQPLSEPLTPIDPPAHILTALMHDLPPQTRRSAAAHGSTTASSAAYQANDAAMPAALNNANGFDDGSSLMALLRQNQRQTDLWRSFAGVAVAACLLMSLYFLR